MPIKTMMIAAVAATGNMSVIIGATSLSIAELGNHQSNCHKAEFHT